MANRSESSYKTELDLSELGETTYECIDGCALCCLCQPELLPHEEEKFRSDPELMSGVTDEHISPEVDGAAIKLQGAHGACHFLKRRRCGVYNDRLHFCKAFPISVFAGWRIQLNVNMSCRGIGLPGKRLAEHGMEILDAIGETRVDEELESAQDVFYQFSKNAKDTKTIQSAGSVREACGFLSDDMLDEIGLSRILTYAEHGNTRQNSPAQDIARRARASEPETNVDELALMLGTELFDLPDLSYLPVYVDERLDWKVFQLSGRNIVGHDLSEDGTIKEFVKVNPTDISLMPLSEEGKKEMERYLMLVNSRDCFLGHAAYLCDEDGYGYNFGQAYLGAMANTIVDLWWRSSFLALLRDKEMLGRDEVREGVIFFDMDLLDLPTIGAFI